MNLLELLRGYPRARTLINLSAVLLRARTLINLSIVLYEQSAARLSLPAKVSNIDLNFVPSIAFISNVHIANSLRARTLINLSAVLYEQAAAQTSLSTKISNIDLNFMPSVAFISNVYIANSLRARTLINLSAVLPRARTLINLSAVLYKQADAQSSLSAKVSIIDLNFVPSIAFDAIGNVELTGDLPGNADCVNNNNNNVALTLQFSLTALLNLQSLASKHPALSSSNLNCRRTDLTIATLLAKRIKTNEDYKKSTHPENNRNNLNIIVTNSTSREFGRVDIKSLTRLSSEGPLGLLFSELISITLQLYCKRKELGSIYVLRIISKLDKVPTREPSSYIKIELYLLCDNSHKFYRLIITSEDTHCKQTIKKAYIMSLERALLILFII
ncbi:hypothetical protein HBI18_241710 [Parastagonospora nodorum]|nr:hypothetical protein HBI18_241710 [Parastagonospora nodorum]